MTDRIAELRAAVAHLRDAHVDDRRHMMIDFISLGEVGALLDCAEALVGCIPLLHMNFPSNDKGMAHLKAVLALARLHGERDAD